MKKSYKKLYILEFIIFVLCLLNSFVFDFLNNYGMSIFLLLTLIIFKFLFGFEKDNHRFTKDILLEVLIFLLSYFMIYYLLGILVGFARVDNYWSFYGIIQYIIPLILSVCLQEFLRYAILTKSEGCQGLIITTTILFIIINVTNALTIDIFMNPQSLFMFFAITLLPAITNNLLCTYLCIQSGYKPNILYQLIINLYSYLLPIIPDPNEYIKSIIDFLLPVFFIYRIKRFLKKNNNDEEIKRDYRKKNLEFLVPGLIVVLLVYFVSGYFRYYAIAIASESMQPNIDMGDIVVIDQKTPIEDIKEDMVIAYKYQGIVIVHRVNKIINDRDETIYYTKGDANNDVDSWSVKKDDIVGRVTLRIKGLGLPTVWINNLLER